MQLNQYIAIFLLSYIGCFPILAWMMPNTPQNHRTSEWVTLTAWVKLLWLTRVFISGIVVLSAILWAL